jgi:hypothetical protein
MRLFLLCLILANALYFAWSQRLLEGMGFAPADQHEPKRLAQQIHPESVSVLSPSEVKALEEQTAKEAAVPDCLQAGPFDATQNTALRAALESSLPVGSWELTASATPARWIIYMGKFANADAQTKKRNEIAVMNLPMEPLLNPALEPGFSLGSFDNKAAAEARLTQLGQRGIHTAKVVQEREESQSFQLRLPAVSEALKTKLNEVKPALAGKSLHSCS